jgi:hypothetical protein
MMSSGRNVTLLLIIMFMSGSFKSGVEGHMFQKKRVLVSIRNDLTNVLTLVCHSSENKLGTQSLQANEKFSFDFKPNLWRSTKFVCDFTFLDNNVNTSRYNVLIYKYKRDTKRCDRYCLLGVNQTHVTQYDDSNVVRLTIPL